MFNFFSRHRKHEGNEHYFPITTDIHSHILPGLDDGSPDLNTSIGLIQGLIEMGISKSIATPHIIGDMYPNTPGKIKAALEALRIELANRQIKFEVFAAAEYMLDSHFLELLKDKKPLLAIQDKIILTEFPYSTFPDYAEQMTFEIMTEGYSPILAHPERYSYTHSNYKAYHRWIELGFLLQVNLLSFTGYYGKEVAKAAAYLLKHNMISFIATDLHHERHLAMLAAPQSRKLFKSLLGNRSWNGLFTV